MRKTKLIVRIVALIILCFVCTNLTGCLGSRVLKDLVVYSFDLELHPVYFMHEQENIVSIEIVEVLYNIESDPRLTTRSLLVVDDIQEFLDKLKQIPRDSYIGGPEFEDYKTIGFKISYDNGDYEIQVETGRGAYYAEKDIFDPYENHSRYYDEEEFGEFIESYIGYYY